MDDETRKAFDNMLSHLDSMMLQINNQFEKLLDDNKTFKSGITYLLGSHVNLEYRVTNLEKKLRKRK